MIKIPCYIYWDDTSTAEEDRKIYIQCGNCFKINKKGFQWPSQMLHGKNTIKCTLCNTIIYEKKKKKKNNEQDKKNPPTI